MGWDFLSPSANVNDRSMRGDRDSEVAILVQDNDLVGDLPLSLLPLSSSSSLFLLLFSLPPPLLSSSPSPSVFPLSVLQGERKVKDE